MSDAPASLSGVASPCIGTCLLDPRSGRCRGCGRTGAEIAAWPRMSDSERAALLARLAARPGPSA